MKHQSTIRILAKSLAIGSLAFSLQGKSLLSQGSSAPTWDDSLNDLRVLFSQFSQMEYISPQKINCNQDLNDMDSSTDEFKEELSECYDIWNSTLRSYPDGFFAMYHRGLLRLKMGDQQGAFSDIAQALLLNPELRDRDEYKNLSPLNDFDCAELMIERVVNYMDNFPLFQAYGCESLDLVLARFEDITRQLEAAASDEERRRLERELSEAALQIPSLVGVDLERFRKK